ncbi:hypothetical protein [Actinomadura harenae]|nr:hypothetical protein [Actinomadura harenae]
MHSKSPIMRKAAVLGASLAFTLGVMIAPAQAATNSTAAATTGSVTQQTAGTWHFWKSYWTKGECKAAGKKVLNSSSRYRGYLCGYATGTDHKWKWHLYIYY